MQSLTRPLLYTSSQPIFISSSKGSKLYRISRNLVALVSNQATDIYGDDPAQRQQDAFEKRKQTAQAYADEDLKDSKNNGDEERYDDFSGSFSKSLEHNYFGEVTPSSFESFRAALRSGKSADFEDIQVGNPGQTGLVSPQAAYAFELFGRDGQAYRLEPAPTFNSAETAAEMAELYWYALTRDIPFYNYSSSSNSDDGKLINQAVEELNSLSESRIFPGDPEAGGKVTPQTLFRSSLPGATTGPFISQYLLQPFRFGHLDIEQKYQFPEPGPINNYLTTFKKWLDVQNGVAVSPEVVFPKPKPGDDSDDQKQKRLLATMRDLGEFVHVDYPIQSGLFACLYLLDLADKYPEIRNTRSNFYKSSMTQSGFATFGPADITHLVTHGPRVALTAAWYQKWLVHRRLRPEVYAGRINQHLRGLKIYDINQEILESKALAEIRRLYPNEEDQGLLPMGYPEGSPSHPAYPGGHSAFSGAAATLVKAFFNEDFVLPKPIMPDADGESVPYDGEPLTVGGELNKLVGNITHGRDGAGMHWRSDGRGNYIGEEVAISILQDYSVTYNEDFEGFELTKFNGQKILIKDGKVKPLK